MLQKSLLGFFFLLSLAFYACGVKATQGITMSKEATKGHALYQDNCGKCHGLKEIKAFTEQRWNEVLPGMIAEARLSDSDGKLVSAYVYEALAFKNN